MADVLRSTTFQLEFQGQDGITGIRQFTKAITDTDAAVDALSNTLGENVKVTAKNVTTQAESVRQAREVISQMEKTNARVKEMTDLYNRQAAMVGKTANEQEVLNAVHRLGAKATQEQKDQITALVQNYQRLRSESDNTGGSFRNLRGMSQQVGWQLQDVAVQAQMGTSAFVILSQQGSQLAAAFGPTGALVGAGIAVVSALAGVASAALSAKTEIKELDAVSRKLMDVRLDTMIGMRDLLKSTSDEKVLKQYNDLSNAIFSVNVDLENQKKVVEDLAKARQAAEEDYTKEASPNLEIQTRYIKLNREYNDELTKQADITSNLNQLRKEQGEIVDSVEKAKRDAEKADKKAEKDAERAAKKAEAQAASVLKKQETAFDSLVLNMVKQTNTVEEEYSRRKAIIDDHVKRVGKEDQESADAYEALEKWKTEKLSEEYVKREAVRRQIEKAQFSQAKREDPVGEENRLLIENLKTLNDQKRGLGESELAERQRIDSLIESEMDRHTSRLAEITNTQLISQLENYATFTGALGTVFSQLQAMAEDGSKEAAALFYINQAIALADTIVNTELAATKAMGQLGVFGIPASTLIRATGYASAGIIAGQTITGAYDKGGYIPSGGIGIVSEYEDELVDGQLVKGPARVTSSKETAELMNKGTPTILFENRVPNVRYSQATIDKDTIKIVAEQVFADNIDKGVSGVLGNRNSKATKTLKNNFTTRSKF